MTDSKTLDVNIRIAIAGPPDAGKSSLIGVLKSGKSDDGRGSARALVLKTRHELETGRTSCISFHSLVKNEEKERKIVTLIDLAGHEKYMKTTMYGINGLNIDYGIILVASNMGMSNITKEHMGMMYTLKIPFIVIVTKLDMCPENILKQTLENIKIFFKKNLPSKKIFLIKNKEKDSFIYEQFQSSTVVTPLFQVSNKTQVGIDLIQDFIFSLRSRFKSIDKNTQGTIYKIDSTFYVKGIGLVFSGYLTNGKIKVNDELYLGPKGGKFIRVKIKSIHNTIQENISEMTDSGCVSIAFTNKKEMITRHQVRKGMVLLSDVSNVSFSFKANIKILHHATTIKSNYQPVIHCGTIRQVARLELCETKEDKQLLRSGDSASVIFTFMYRPEFLEVNRVFSFRDGATKGIGKIVQVI